MPESTLNWGIDLIVWMQANLDWATGLLNAFTFLGSEEFFLLLFPFLAWCIDLTFGIRLYVYLGISLYTNLIAKVLIHDPRPYWFDGRVRLLTDAETAFGAPSGHAQNAVVIWGYLAAAIRKYWAWLLAAVIVLMIGISRFHLGVHFPTDVFLGWALGLAVLLAAMRLDAPVVAWFRKFDFSRQLGLLFVLSALLLLLAALEVRAVEAGAPVADFWLENVRLNDPGGLIAPYAMSPFTTAVSSAFGGLAGVMWISRRKQFDAGGAWTKRIARYALGMVGALAFWLGLDILFSALAADETLVGQALRFIRYASVGFWVGGLAPMLFLRLGLAAEKQA
jgi:membrane-associated phospholipid phosphatase